MVHRNTIADWLGLCEEEGSLKGLCKVGEPDPDPGQQSIPPEIMEQLRKRLSEPEGFGGYKEIQRWLAEQNGVERPYSTVHRIVRDDLEAKPKTPWYRNSYTSTPQSEREQVAFKEGLPARVDEIRSETSRSVRLFCQSESRFGLMPITGRRITLSGIKPIHQQRSAYQSYYLYGAIEPECGERLLRPVPQKSERLDFG